MSRMDELPPDQRAALSLLLLQHKSYAEVSGAARHRRAAVHDRAHAAIVLLAPGKARELTAERRQEIGDYLLGQQGVAERLRTRALMNSSEPARAWAADVAAQLAPMAGSSMPEVPAGPAGADCPRSGAAARRRSVLLPVLLGRVRRIDLVASASGRSQRSSRVGGAILLAVLVAAVVVAVVLLTGGSSAKKPNATATSRPPARSPKPARRSTIRSR